jgi:HAMP domain-containing protein
MKFFNAIWPSSLWGRLSLLLLSALMVAQLASAMLHFRDRGAALLQAAGIESAQRIAGIVRILDPLTPAQRDEVVDALDFPPLRLGLADSPSPLPNGDTRSSRAVLFKRMLQLQLDQGRQLDVTLRSSTELQKERPYELQSPDIASSTPMQGMMAHHTGGHAWARDLHTLAIDPSFSFLVQVRLHGGQWAHFAYFIPEDTIHWPWDLFWALLLLTLVVIVVSFLAVRWLTRPLTELATAADELGKDIQHPPLPETGPTEVHRAARAFNQMQSRLRSFVEERTRILAAVSHDLKTPITRMRLRVEAIENETLRAG